MAKRATNPFQPIIESIPVPFRNRYFLVLALFFLWMIFFDRHDFITQWKLSQSVQRLERDMTFYDEKVEETKLRKKEIENNREKFAREQYYMHRSDEDVFIIKENKK